MNSGFQEDDIMRETMSRMDANRRKAFRFNLLLILFFLVVMLGLFGAIRFYNALESKKAELKLAYDELEKKNVELDSIRAGLAKDKAIRDTIINQIYKPEDINRVKGFDTIIKKIDNSREAAGKYARSGYMKLKSYDFKRAMEDFRNSDKTYNGYRDSYEVYILLWKNKDRLDDKDAQREIMVTILKKYNSLRMLSYSDIRR